MDLGGRTGGRDVHAEGDLDIGVGFVALARFDVHLTSAEQQAYMDELVEQERRRRPLGFAEWGRQPVRKPPARRRGK